MRSTLVYIAVLLVRSRILGAIGGVVRGLGDELAAEPRSSINGVLRRSQAFVSADGEVVLEPLVKETVSSPPERDDWIKSWLQEWEEPQRRDNDADDAGIPIYLDGHTRTNIPRRPFQGNTTEALYQINVSEWGIVINGSHAFIPFETPMRAKYMRNIHVFSSREFGISNMMWYPNPSSVLSDKIVVGLAEKMHIFYYSGNWSTASFDRVVKEREQRSYWKEKLASVQRYVRNRLVNSFLGASHLGTQLTRAGVDPNHVAQVRAHVAAHDGKPAESTMERLAHMSQTLRSRMDAARPLKTNQPRSLGTLSNCFHFEKMSLINVTEKGTHLPLRTKLVSYRGHASFAPLRRFGILTGTSFLNYDETKHILEIYFTASSQMELLDPAEAHKDDSLPTFFVAPADGGIEMPVAGEGRVQPYEPSIKSLAIYSAFQLIPLDYNYLFHDPNEVCSISLFRSLKRAFTTFDTLGMVTGHVKWSDSARLIDLLSGSSRCGTVFLRSDLPNSHGYNVFEALVWGHMVMETPMGHTIQLVGNRDWDSALSKAEGFACTRQTGWSCRWFDLCSYAGATCQEGTCVCGEGQRAAAAGSCVDAAGTTCA